MTRLHPRAPIVTHFDPQEHGVLSGVNPPNGTCPECHEHIEPGSLRWTGYSWEHKGGVGVAQAGHHVVYPRSGAP